MQGSFASESLGLGCGKQKGVSVLLNDISFMLSVSLSRQSLFPQNSFHNPTPQRREMTTALSV
jgi:hypothetical protein